MSVVVIVSTPPVSPANSRLLPLPFPLPRQFPRVAATQEALHSFADPVPKHSQQIWLLIANALSIEPKKDLILNPMAWTTHGRLYSYLSLTRRRVRFGEWPPERVARDIVLWE
jgi:hypothetical protein